MKIKWNKIKGCPFCGRWPQIHRETTFKIYRDGQVEEGEVYSASCDECDEYEGSRPSDYWHNKKAAIKGWNDYTKEMNVMESYVDNGMDLEDGYRADD